MSAAIVKRQEKELHHKTLALSNLRAKMKEHAEQTVEVAATVGGGAIAGYLGVNYSSWQLAGIDAGMAVGAIATVVGLMGWAGNSSNVIGSLGTGMLAYEAGKKVAEK
jgi:predicted transcriptional regulator